LVLMVLAVISRLTGSADATLALFLLCTVSLYLSLAVGLLEPVWIAVVWLFGDPVERRRIFVLLLLSGLNIAVAVIWIFLVLPQLHIRW
jgi:hypothetical protein